MLLRSPSCVATFQYWPLITLHPSLNQQLDSEQKQRFVDCCPTKVYGYNVDSRQVEVEDASKCMFCMEVTTSSNTAHNTTQQNTIFSAIVDLRSLLCMCSLLCSVSSALTSMD